MNRMRILHTADWHIGRSLNGYSLLEDQAYFLNWLSALIQRERVDALLVAGDIYNSSVPSAAAVGLLDDFITDTVLRCRIPVAMIAGNHDSAQRLNFSSRLLEHEGLYIAGDFSAGLKQMTLQDANGQVKVFLFPYIDPADAKQAFPDQTVGSFDQAAGLFRSKYLQGRERGGAQILLAHGFYLNFGEDVGICDSELHVGGSEAVNLGQFSGFDYIALGHLHSPQKAGSVGRYSGSPLKYSISEARQKKQVVLLEVSPGQPIHAEPIPAPCLRDVRVERGELEELIRRPSEDYVAVELTDRSYCVGAMQRLRAAFPYLLELRYVNIQQSNPSEPFVRREIQPERLFAEFFEKVTGSELTEQERQMMQRVVKEAESEAD